jgi:hypothetical protein
MDEPKRKECGEVLFGVKHSDWPRWSVEFVHRHAEHEFELHDSIVEAGGAQWGVGAGGVEL